MQKWAVNHKNAIKCYFVIHQSLALMPPLPRSLFDILSRNHPPPLGSPTINSPYALMDSITLLNLSKFMSHVYNQITNSMKSASIPIP